MGMFNPMEMMGKIKEMQSEMEKAKQRLDDIIVHAEAGGGMVKVTANANKLILKIEVDQDLVDPEDKEVMEDLIAAAVNRVMEMAEVRAREEIQSASSGILPNIPGIDFSKFGM